MQSVKYLYRYAKSGISLPLCKVWNIFTVMKKIEISLDNLREENQMLQILRAS